MATGNLFQRHLISMPALARQFKLGDLYSYNADKILPGEISTRDNNLSLKFKS